MILEVLAFAASVVSLGLWLDLRRKFKGLDTQVSALLKRVPESPEEGDARRARQHAETMAKSSTSGSLR